METGVKLIPASWAIVGWGGTFCNVNIYLKYFRYLQVNGGYEKN